MQNKRVILLAGHYGSGKTNIAVNMAMSLKKAGKDVVIADMDIVNPYYRTKDSQEELEAMGIPLIGSSYANSNVDVPALPQELYSIIDNKNTMAVLDIGGDDRGAYALGRFAPGILAENNYEMYFVMNCYRPLTRDAASTVEVLREIEQAGGIPVTALINNSNLGAETTAEDVAASLAYAKEVSEKTGLPLHFTAVEQSLAEEVSKYTEHVFRLKLQNKRIWN